MKTWDEVKKSISSLTEEEKREIETQAKRDSEIFTKEVTIWEKLKLQIDNLEIMSKHHDSGVNVSNSVYWQLETLYELLGSVGEQLGVTEEVKNQFL